MKIGIVLHPFDEDRPAGLARTIFEFTNGLLSIDQRNEYIIFTKKKPRTKPHFPGANWRLEDLGGGVFWLDNLKKKTCCDVYLFNTPVLPFIYRPPNAVVLALDFAYYYLAIRSVRGQVQKWLTFLYHKWSLFRADRVVAISEATKIDVVKLFKYPKDRIAVVYLGYKKICDEKEVYVSLPPKFFFFAGIIKERKNVMNIVRAFLIFSKDDKEHALVIGGDSRGVYFERVKKFVEENDLSGRVIFAGHLNDGQLSYAYRRATAFVFPTLIEGFGMPVAEAMDCGTPVVTSNQSSLQEVGGGAALLVNPYDPRDIAGAMKRVVIHKGLREELIKRGYVQRNKFSWVRSSRDLLDIMKQVAGSNS